MQAAKCAADEGGVTGRLHKHIVSSDVKIVCYRVTKVVKLLNISGFLPLRLVIFCFVLHIFHRFRNNL